MRILVTGGKTVADYYLLDLMMSISLKWSPQLKCTAFNMGRRPEQAVSLLTLLLE